MNRKEIKWTNAQYSGTAKNFAGWDASGVAVEIAPASSSDIITGADDTKPLTAASFAAVRTLVRQPAPLAGGVVTLDMVGRRESKFENTTPFTANFSIAFANMTNAEIFTLIIQVTGSIVITFPSSVISLKADSRFNNTTKTLTITGVASDVVELSFSTMTGPKYILKASGINYAS